MFITDKSNTTQPNTEELNRRIEEIRKNNRVSFGWLRFTDAFENLRFWRKRIKEYFSTDTRSRDKGWNGYLYSEIGAYSIYIAYTPRLTEEQRKELGVKRSPNEGYCTIDIPQSALDSLSEINFYKLMIDLYGFDTVSLTRVDIYYDDYLKVIDPESVHKACKQGGVGVPRINNMRGWDEYDLQDGVSRGYTVYFGSNQSEKQIRFYDKEQESNGDQCCYRWEVQLTGQYANQFYLDFYDNLLKATGENTLALSVAKISNVLKSYVKGSINFLSIPKGKRTKDLDSNWAKRSEVVWWWSELMYGLEPAKITLERKPPSLSGLVDWLNSQVFPSIAVIQTVYRMWGIPFHHWMSEHIDKAKERFSDRHMQLINEGKMISPAL